MMILCIIKITSKSGKIHNKARFIVFTWIFVESQHDAIEKG